MFDDTNCSSCADCTADCSYNGSATVTLSLDDGTAEECTVLTIFEAAGRTYIALLPLDEAGQNEDGEVYIYRFNDSSGEPQLDNIESEEEYRAASEGFDRWLVSRDFDELVYVEEEEEA